MTEFIEKLLNDICTKFKAEKAENNAELEIRFKPISRDVFEQLFTALKSDKSFTNPSLECSVNIISENIYESGNRGKSVETQYIQKVIIVNGIGNNKTFYEKSRLMRPIQITDYINYSVGLSKEVSVSEQRTSSNPLLRFKIRSSFSFDNKWRFDLTAVKESHLKEIGNSLSQIRKEVFPVDLTIDNLLSKLPYSSIDKYEIEIEYIGSPNDIVINDINIVKKLFALINTTYLQEIAYQEEIYNVAKYIVSSQMLNKFKLPNYRLKQLANQVIALSKNTYYTDIFPPVGYFLTDKADGLRCIVKIYASKCRILLSDSMIEFTSDKDDKIIDEITIVDAELVGGNTIYLFDCMVFRDEVLVQKGFEERIEYLQDSADNINKLLLKATPKNFVCKVKKFEKLELDTLQKQITQVSNEKHEYTTDGYIFTEPGESYANTKNYKWKPYERTTIDFLAMKCPKLGVQPYIKKEGLDLYLLFVGISNNMREQLGMGFIPLYRDLFPAPDAQYYPIQFSPSFNPTAYLYYHTNTENLDKRIIELGRDEFNTQWVFHQVRNDRKMEKTYFGNDFKIAELTYLNYIDKFTLSDLWSESSGYFTKSATDIYAAPNKFKRFVISTVLKDNFSNFKWIIDEAAGRGADLHRYKRINVQNALFIDIDGTAIAELIRRKFEFFATERKRGGHEPSTLNSAHVLTKYDRIHDIEYDKLIEKDSKNLTIHTLVADLKTPSNELISLIYKFGANKDAIDGIVCNFALHYLCDVMTNIKNILTFNAKMLRVNGIFMFTVMDGAKVFKLLSENHISQNMTYEIREGEILKYAITRKYAGDKFAKMGQIISVLLPLNDKMLDEPLCNVDMVIAEAKKLNFEVEICNCMDKYLDAFKYADKALYDRLTQDDIKYISLHSVITLRKIK
jgi:hypothetical protein